MKLIEQIIKMKIQLSEEHLLNKNYSRGIWDFYCAYNLSMGILEQNYKNKRIKNRLWSNFILKSMSSVDEKKFKTFENGMKKDFKIVTEALSLIQKKKELMGMDYGEEYPDGVIGISAFEVED